ncbi:MAG: hypothetical protein V4717_15335 [Bacteroidota bacterium]
MTDEGRELHDRCFKQQQEFRIKTMQHISEEDYEVTIRTLQQMVANLSLK